MPRLFSKSLLISTLVVGALGFQNFNTLQNAVQAKCSSSLNQTDGDKPSMVEETINGKNYCVSRVLVKASPEQVWQVLTDYRHATKIFPLLKKCEITKDNGCNKLVRHEIAPSGIPDTFEYILEVRETAPKIVEWRRLSGDFKEVDGFWKLEPANFGNYTLVTYASHVTGGFLMPQMIIKRQSHIDMPNTLSALKKHTENTIQIASRKPDTVTR